MDQDSVTDLIVWLREMANDLENDQRNEAAKRKVQVERSKEEVERGVQTTL